MRIPFFSRKTKINNSVLDTINISGTDAECVPGLTSSASGMSRPMSAKSAYAGVAPVQNGISKIASNAAKAKINLYTFDGEAIIGGPLYDLLNRPNKYCSQRDFCNAFYSWYLMLGEAAVLKMGKPGLAPEALTILDPSNLRVLTPENPNDIEEVRVWQYIWRDGVIATISSSQLMYAKMFSAGQLRGISPLVSGMNQIMAYQGAWTYASKFFSRGATPNLMVSFPANYGKKNIEAAKQMWEDTFGGVDKAWSVLFTTGDTEVNKLDTGLKDALADQILHMAEQDIYQIYSVPPIISGDWANAKYDSAAEQLETFAENTLFPLLEVLTDVLQTQVVDPYVWTGNIIEKKTTLSTSMKQRFEQAKAEAKAGSIIVLVDPDSLPIMSRIKRASLKNAADAKLAFGLSTKDVDEYFNLGLTLNEYSDLVLFPSNVVTAENLVKPPAPPVAPVAPNADPNAQPEDPNADPVAQNNARKPSKEEVGAISKALLEMRKYATDQVINDRTLKLREFEKSISNPILKKECRSIFAQISNALKSCESSIEKQAAIKNVFNSIPRSRLRDLASEIINDVDL